jgi:hypothetical protein
VPRADNSHCLKMWRPQSPEALGNRPGLYRTALPIPFVALIKFTYVCCKSCKVDQKYLERFKVSFWRRMEKIHWADHVTSEEALHRVKEERNVLYTTERRKANWSSHIQLINPCQNMFLKEI